MAGFQRTVGNEVLVYTNAAGFDIASGARQLIIASGGANVHWSAASFAFDIASTTSAGGVVNGVQSGLVLEDADGLTLLPVNADAMIQGDGLQGLALDKKGLPQGVSFIGRMQPVPNKSIYLKNYTGRVVGRYAGSFVEQRPGTLDAATQHPAAS